MSGYPPSSQEAQPSRRRRLRQAFQLRSCTNTTSLDTLQSHSESHSDNTVTIDYTSFPHIMDNIYESTTGDRKHFRALDKKFRERVDEDLSWHIGVSAAHSLRFLGFDVNEGDTYHPRVSPVTARALSGFWQPCQNQCNCDSIYFKVDVKSEAHAIFRPIARDSCETVRVLDLIFPPDGHPRNLPMLPNPISTLRIIPAASTDARLELCLRRAATEVQANSIVLFTRPRRDYLALQPLVEAVPWLKFNARRLVINVGIPCPRDAVTGTHDEANASQLANPLHIYPVRQTVQTATQDPVTTLRECVYIFDPAWKTWQGSTSRSSALTSLFSALYQHVQIAAPEVSGDEGSLLDYTLDSVAFMIGAAHLAFGNEIKQPMRFVFVGAESLPPVSISMHNDPSWPRSLFQEQIYGTTRKPKHAALQDEHYARVQWCMCSIIMNLAFKAYCAREPSFPILRWALSTSKKLAKIISERVEFRTREEHRALVGDMEFRVETVGYSWQGIEAMPQQPPS